MKKDRFRIPHNGSPYLRGQGFIAFSPGTLNADILEDCSSLASSAVSGKWSISRAEAEKSSNFLNWNSFFPQKQVVLCPRCKLWMLWFCTSSTAAAVWPVSCRRFRSNSKVYSELLRGTGFTTIVGKTVFWDLIIEFTLKPLYDGNCFKDR